MSWRARMGAEPAPHVAARAPRGAEVLVRAVGLSFGYAHEAVLRDVTLEVRAGEFVALVGPNGSGKSTLLKVLLGALEPQSGRVELLGRSPGDVRDRWRVGYVPQRPSLLSEVPATVEEIVAAGRLRRRGWWRGPHDVRPRGGSTRDRVRRARGARAASAQRALDRAATASLHRQGVRRGTGAAGPRRADRGGGRRVPASLPRLARPPDPATRRRRACSSHTSSPRWPT